MPDGGGPKAGSLVPIGREGHETLAVAFEGGAFDTAMQVGFVQALAVSRSRPPDVAAGISAGAINAVVLAEVLQTRPKADGSGDLVTARLHRLQEFVDAFLDAPRDLLRSVLPDAYEVKAARALEPARLPIHFAEERRDRGKSVLAKAGVTRLMNHLLAMDLTIATMTRGTRRVLALLAAREERRPLRKVWKFAWEGLGLYALLLRNVLPLTPIVAHLGFAILQRSVQDLAFGQRFVSGGAGAIIHANPLRSAGRAAGYLLAFPLTLLLVAFSPVLVVLVQVGRSVRDVLSFRVWKADRRTAWGWLRRTVLGSYSISRSLARAHILRTLFVKYFDRSYYGEVSISKAVDSALRGDGRPGARRGPPPRRLSSYHIDDKVRPIHVAALAADVATGGLVTVPEQTAVVDALLAATALAPVFPAVRIPATEPDGRAFSRYLIDGTNVANEPIAALVDLLRERVHEESTGIRVVTVSQLPVEKGRLGAGKPGEDYLSSVDVTRRVLQLRRLRDAGLERKLTRIYSKLIPPGRARRTVQHDGKEHVFVHVVVHPVEPDEPMETNRKLLRAKDETEARERVLEAMADGCRLTLESILGPEIERFPSQRITPQGRHWARCIDVVRARSTDSSGLAGRQWPGLDQVCSRCVLTRVSTSAGPGAPGQALNVRKGRADWTWPREEDGDKERRKDVATGLPPKELSPAVPRERPAAATRAVAGQRDRPWVSVLLSGGVFRGVFQVGVLSGLSEAGVRPRLFAGASVGAIMAGMGARVWGHDELAVRRHRLHQLAATFLALDRLVLTDRFADFVRNFTIRAASAEFSPRDLDRVFRRYDEDPSWVQARRLGRVVAGLERLLYLSFFDLGDWTRAGRARDLQAMADLLRRDLGDLLTRFGIGNELLGADPLHLLIQGLVEDNGAQSTFAGFGTSDHPVSLLAVATDLTDGCLTILPERPQDESEIVLAEALLASSAFPFVFRPRREFEIWRNRHGVRQFVDGGVMDNLPLDAVVRYLDTASTGADPPVARFPAAPHLLLCASLEPDVRPLDREEAARRAEDWVLLHARARMLSYNRKISSFQRAQRQLALLDAHRANDDFVPLDIVVGAIKPRWLCGTAAFHPMLGFRRRNQAASIAHGCATTLASLQRLAEDPQTRGWVNEGRWGFVPPVPPEDRGRPAAPRKGADEQTHLGLGIDLVPGKPKVKGGCWFRPETVCPFSSAGIAANAQDLEQVKDPPPRLETLEGEMQRELPAIYRECGKWSTHRPRSIDVA